MSYNIEEYEEDFKLRLNNLKEESLHYFMVTCDIVPHWSDRRLNRMSDTFKDILNESFD